MSRAPIGVLALLATLGLAACTTATSSTSSPAAPGTVRTVTSSPAPATAAPPSPSTAASRPAPPPTPARGTGIVGVTTVSVCPVVRAESPCPATPVRARLSIMDAGTGAVVAAVSSGSDGRFTVAVKPGRYLIRLVALGAGPPRPQAPAEVTVNAGHYTTVTLHFDSGIR